MRLAPNEMDLFDAWLRVESEWLDSLVRNIGVDRASAVLIQEMLMEDSQPIQ